MGFSAIEWVVFFLIVYFLIAPTYSAFVFTRPPRLRISFRKPSDLGFTYQPATFTSSDGAEMAGWYLPSQNGAAVILLHGHSANRLGVLFHMEILARAGFGVLLFDLRAHGSSEGKRFMRGKLLVDDVLGALSYLRRQPELTAGHIGIMGVSIGGMLALQAAAVSQEIRAVAADGPSPAAVVDLMPPRSARHWLNVPRNLLHERVTGWLTRAQPLPSALSIMPRIAPRPLLLISTGSSNEQWLVRRLYDAAREPKSLWEIPKAQHGAGWRGGREEVYGERIVAFFSEALLADGR